MLNDDEVLDLADLSDRAGVSQRTVRYYIQQGLLPSPETRGPGSHYGPEHLDRLRLIRRFQREHFPLAEIRKRLEAMEPEEISRLARLEPKQPAGDARDYIRSVLSEGAPIMSAHSLREPDAVRRKAEMFTKDKARKSLTRSQWERIPLGPDVELHVRRPLAREQIKQVERLLEAARHIFEED